MLASETALGLHQLLPGGKLFCSPFPTLQRKVVPHPCPDGDPRTSSISAEVGVHRGISLSGGRMENPRALQTGSQHSSAEQGEINRARVFVFAQQTQSVFYVWGSAEHLPCEDSSRGLRIEHLCLGKIQVECICLSASNIHREFKCTPTLTGNTGRAAPYVHPPPSLCQSL